MGHLPGRRGNSDSLSRRAGRWRCALGVVAAGLAASLLANPAQAAPAVQLGYGFDDKHKVEKADVAVQWDSGFAWGNPTGWQADLLWEANVAWWHSTSDHHPRNPWEFGFTPVMRVAWRRHAWVPYLELGAGVRLITETRTSDDHAFSTAFQFSEFAGLGVAFGKDQRYAVGYRYQHISNAGIKEPNPGTGFNTIYLRYHF